LRGRLSEADLEDLVNALSLLWGPEAMIALRDACRLEPEEAKATMLRAARWMLAGALAELGIARPGAS